MCPDRIDIHERIVYELVQIHKNYNTKEIHTYTKKFQTKNLKCDPINCDNAQKYVELILRNISDLWSISQAKITSFLHVN